MVPLKNVDMESLALSSHPDFIELIEKATFLLTFLLHLNQYNTDIDLNTVAHRNEKLQQQRHFRKEVNRLRYHDLSDYQKLQSDHGLYL